MQHPTFPTDSSSSCSNEDTEEPNEEKEEEKKEKDEEEKGDAGGWPGLAGTPYIIICAETFFTCMLLFDQICSASNVEAVDYSEKMGHQHEHDIVKKDMYSYYSLHLAVTPERHLPLMRQYLVWRQQRLASVNRWQHAVCMANSTGRVQAKMQCF
eukprot:1704736-Amphidinium_carterae.1